MVSRTVRANSNTGRDEFHLVPIINFDFVRSRRCCKGIEDNIWDEVELLPAGVLVHRA
jgi:hypothetical protein